MTKRLQNKYEKTTHSIRMVDRMYLVDLKRRENVYRLCGANLHASAANLSDFALTKFTSYKDESVLIRRNIKIDIFVGDNIIHYLTYYIISNCFPEFCF